MAVKVTLWPTVEGLGEDPRVVLVVPRAVLTVWLTVPVLVA